MYSDKQLKELSKKVYENACELLNEAIILYDAKCYSRAYVLAHLSSEEIAKLPTIYGIRVLLTEKEVIDWKRFKFRLNNHQSKLRSIALFDYMSDDVDLLRNQDLKKYQHELSLIQKNNSLKNIGLYSDYHENEAYKPSEKLSAEDAINMINLTKTRIIRLETRWLGMIEGVITKANISSYKILQGLIKPT